MKNLPDTSEEVFEQFNLHENSVYLVEVKTSSTNVEHRSILFTGFKSGAYCELYQNTYDRVIPMMEIHSMKVIRKLVKILNLNES